MLYGGRGYPLRNKIRKGVRSAARVRFSERVQQPPKRCVHEVEAKSRATRGWGHTKYSVRGVRGGKRLAAKGLFARAAVR